MLLIKTQESLHFNFSPSTSRGGHRPEGAGLPEGSGRAEFGEIRGGPLVGQRLLVCGVPVGFGRGVRDACGEGRHDGAEPAQQPGDDGGTLLH